MGIFSKNENKTRTTSYDSYREVLEKIIIEKDGYFSINPAIYFFILYNPITGINRKDSKVSKKFLLEKISDEDLQEFLSHEHKIIEIYETKIFSKMSEYLNSLLGTHFSFNMGVETNNLQYFEKIQKGRLRSIINTHLSFECNREFRAELESNFRDVIYELQNNSHDTEEKDVYMFYSRENKIIFMFRKKTKESIISKFDVLFNKLDTNLQENFIELSAYILSFSRRLFEGNHYQQLYKLTQNENGKNYFLPKQDIYAVRLIRLDQNQSLDDLKIANNLKQNQFGKYYIQHLLKDDHRERILQNRPRGIHHIYTDVSYFNFAFEFQFLDFKSLIFTYFGETKDSFKSLRKYH
ncbi:MAG: hypothetical protein LAT82_03940 [Nanoarchaeota archaeon]|nr:hypothetical protein [Nanoarchaeota archaeon]